MHFFYSMAQKRNIEATNTAPSPKRTTRATSRADKGTSRGSVVNDETTEVDEGRKHAEQVSFRAEKLCCMNLFLWLTCSMSALAALYMNYVVACMDLFLSSLNS
jgi:hypothetical protein